MFTSCFFGDLLGPEAGILLQVFHLQNFSKNLLNLILAIYLNSELTNSPLPVVKQKLLNFSGIFVRLINYLL